MCSHSADSIHREPTQLSVYLSYFVRNGFFGSEAWQVGISWFRHLVAAPLQEYRWMGVGVDIYIVEIAVDVWQFHQSLIHDVEPEPGKVCEDVHAEVSIR